jgi:Ubiquitin carboxyl-terminal hydrolase
MEMNGSATAVRRKCTYVLVSYSTTCTAQDDSSYAIPMPTTAPMILPLRCFWNITIFTLLNYSMKSLKTYTSRCFAFLCIHRIITIIIIVIIIIQASKQLTIYKTPNVLVIHLKRFSYGGVSGKISKNVAFDFSMSVPCTGIPGVVEKIPYSLIGIVVHHGSSIHSGHYVAFVKVSSTHNERM